MKALGDSLAAIDERLVDAAGQAGALKATKTRVLVLDAAHTLARVSREGHSGLAMQLALAQLAAAGVDVVGPESMEAFAQYFDPAIPDPPMFTLDSCRVPEPVPPEPPRYDKRDTRTRAPRWRSPGEGKPAGSKLARKAARGRL